MFWIDLRDSLIDFRERVLHTQHGLCFRLLLFPSKHNGGLRPRTVRS